MTFKEKLTTILAMLYSFIKPLLFSLDPETAHNITLEMARLSPLLGKLSGQNSDSRFEVKVGGINWTFPLGLAAGLDKNAEALPFFSAQGFGAIECGTVTLKPQLGNPRPRMFRYPAEESLRNAMGFPNKGLLDIMPRLKNYGSSTPLGLNIGKNKDTSPEDSIEELNLIFETLKDVAQYFVINVSSPNTPGLRALQERSYLSELFTELNKGRGDRDLYLKIAPDLTDEKILELTKLAEDFHLTGIIATNTTIMPERGAGGISGALLREKSRSVRKLILKEKTKLELISVGGISSSKDLFDLWKDGGKVAQAYTSYVYQGPELLKHFYRELDQFTSEQKLSLNEFFQLNLEERIYRLKNYPAY
jgi:dihydroorotate dehydrogenase